MLVAQRMASRRCARFGAPEAFVVRTSVASVMLSEMPRRWLGEAPGHLLSTYRVASVYQSGPGSFWL